jgi:hypothetical protein
MGPWLIGFVGLIYLVVAITFARQATLGQAIMFLGFAISNIGMVLTAIGK